VTAAAAHPRHAAAGSPATAAKSIPPGIVAHHQPLIDRRTRFAEAGRTAVPTFASGPSTRSLTDGNGIGIPIAAGVLYPALGWRLSPVIAAAAMALSSNVVSTSTRVRCSAGSAQMSAEAVAKAG
jgi:hypothetical protein